MATQPSTERRAPPYSNLQAVLVTEDDVSLHELTAFVRRHAWLFLLAASLAIVLGVITAIVLPKTYTARASFVPQGRPQASGIATLAAQFGVGVPGGDATRTPSFYLTLLSSRNTLARIVDRRFHIGSAPQERSVSLVEYLGVSGKSPAARQENAVNKLRKRLTVSVDQKASLIAMDVKTGDPQLSRDIARALLAEIDSFNVTTRQSQASSERKFTERRLADARTQLRSAEDELQGFLQGNREYRGSPQLTFLYDRLSRNVSLKQQLYTSLSEAYEQARIEEVRDTPVITVVEQPMLPAKADVPPFARAIALWLLALLSLTVFVAKRRDVGAE